MIELYLLEQLAAVARCGTLVAASERLHLSQPALSQSMKKLETQMGVSLFERTKNKLMLNDTGKLAAGYAEELLRQEREMIERIRLYDQARHTVCLGSCAPVPIGDIVPLLTRFYEGMTISSELKNTDRELWEGLERGRYQCIVVHEEPKKDASIFFVPYRQEHLCLRVPKEHPLAKHARLHLCDLADQNLLLYTYIGFWYELCREKLSAAHFLYMNEQETFAQIAEVSAFPCFTTDAFADQWQDDGKVIVPIADREVNVTYYFVCKKQDEKRFKPLVRDLKQNFSG